MPWGWECRAKLVKQLPAKPTERRGPPLGATGPGPQQYEAPQIFCGNGFGHIKRAPAYTFGLRTPMSFSKPDLKPYAPIFNIRGMGKKGPFKVTHGVVAEQFEPVRDRTCKPGPAAYAPRVEVSYKCTPAYSCRPAARPLYEPWDMWTPPPNMYLPPIPGKKAPKYSMANAARHVSVDYLPGPGDHDPNFDYTKKSKPSYTFGQPFSRVVPPKVPPPNHYCEKKFLVTKRSIPAPSFGIRHSKHLGQPPVFLKSSKLDLIGCE